MYGLYWEQVEGKMTRKIPHQCHFGDMIADGQEEVWRFGLGYSAQWWLPEQECCWMVDLHAYRGAS